MYIYSSFFLYISVSLVGWYFISVTMKRWSEVSSKNGLFEGSNLCIFQIQNVPYTIDLSTCKDAETIEELRVISRLKTSMMKLGDMLLPGMLKDQEDIYIHLSWPVSGSFAIFYSN